MRLPKTEEYIKKLEKKIKETDLDLKAIIEEHERYKPSNEEEVLCFIDSLPIETLKESLNKDWDKPRSKFSLKDINYIFGLHKLYDEKVEDMFKLKSDLYLAKIENIQKKIKKILK